jgi:hypothetical protein
VLIPVWIPTATVTDLAPASVVVTAETPEPTDPPGMTLGWFEGNIHRASGLERFADRAHLAAGRMLERYPTSAMRAFRPSELRLIGHLDMVTGEIHLIDQAGDDLVAWLGIEPGALVEELLTTSARHMARRELRTVDPVTREFLRRHGPPIYRDDV